MAIGDCLAKRQKKLSHDMGPMVHVLQLGSDGGNSLYQVQVNGVPSAELFMNPQDDQSARVRLHSDNKILDDVLIRTIGDGWVAESHKRVNEMLLRYYPGAIVEWHTRGNNVE